MRTWRPRATTIATIGTGGARPGLSSTAAAAAGLALAFGSWSAPARGQDVLPEATSTATAPLPAPPPLDIPYVQYGIAFTAEFVTSAGKMCASVAAPCILGSGGGIVARLGHRSAGALYFGAAYELSKQDPSSLYRFATLQQLRAEGRWYLNTGRDTYPYAALTAGVATYGNEGGIDTYGPAASLGIGVESQISRRTVVGASLCYRVIGLRDFLDSSGYERGTSVVQLVGIDLSLEERNPTASALPRQ